MSISNITRLTRWHQDLLFVFFWIWKTALAFLICINTRPKKLGFREIGSSFMKFFAAIWHSFLVDNFSNWCGTKHTFNMKSASSFSFQAINVLGALNWNADGASCFACLSTIMNSLLKQQLTPKRESKWPNISTDRTWFFTFGIFSFSWQLFGLNSHMLHIRCFWQKNCLCCLQLSWKQRLELSIHLWSLCRKSLCWVTEIPSAGWLGGSSITCWGSRALTRLFFWLSTLAPETSSWWVPNLSFFKLRSHRSSLDGANVLNVLHVHVKFLVTTWQFSNVKSHVKHMCLGWQQVVVVFAV